MICWDVSDILNWRQLFSVKKLVKVITGANQHLEGFIIDNHIHVLNEKLIFELSDDISLL